MSEYTKNDAAKDTDSTVKETSAAWHGAKDDAFGTKEGSTRDATGGGDRPTGANQAEAYEIGKEHGLYK